MNININDWLMPAVFIIGLVVLGGFFRTKVVVIAGLLFSADKLDGQVLANLLFAVVGFAGGLFTAKDAGQGGKGQ